VASADEPALVSDSKYGLNSSGNVVLILLADSKLKTRMVNPQRILLKKLRFHCGSRTAVFPAMSAILKDEELVAVEAAVKAGIAPQPAVAG
jgi:hypothetical protein